MLTHFCGLFTQREDYKVIEQIKNKQIKLVDASIMSLCLKLFPWAKFRTAKGGIKMHVSLDEATMIPEMVNLTPAKVSDRRGADNFRYPAGTIIVDDRGYFDFSLFASRIKDNNHFVTRMKSNTVYQSIGENELSEGKDEHILKDELIRRNISRVYHCFGHFVTLIRVCLTQYNRLEYIASEIQITVQKAKKRYKPPDRSQTVLKFG